MCCIVSLTKDSYLWFVVNDNQSSITLFLSINCTLFTLCHCITNTIMIIMSLLRHSRIPNFHIYHFCVLILIRNMYLCWYQLSEATLAELFTQVSEAVTESFYYQWQCLVKSNCFICSSISVVVFFFGVSCDVDVLISSYFSLSVHLSFFGSQSSNRFHSNHSQWPWQSRGQTF